LFTSIFLIFLIKEKCSLQSKGDANKKKLAIIIGIDEYLFMQGLFGACNDAMAIKNFFSKIGFDALTLCNRAATKENILRALENSAETVVIYFAGHGHEEKQDQPNSFLCPFNFDPHDLNRTAIKFLNLRNILASLQSKYILLLLDCCFSRTIIDPNQVNPPECHRIKRIDVISAGINVREQPFEGEVRGVFTYYLEKGLKHLLIERNNETLVTAPEIVEWMVREMSNEGMGDLLPNYGVLFSTDSIENIGIPKSEEDSEILTKKGTCLNEQLKEWIAKQNSINAAGDDLVNREASLPGSYSVDFTSCVATQYQVFHFPN